MINIPEKRASIIGDNIFYSGLGTSIIGGEGITFQSCCPRASLASRATAASQAVARAAPVIFSAADFTKFKAAPDLGDSKVL